MNGNSAVTVNSDVEVLQRAADYALAAVDTLTPELWSRRTPCSEWDLHMLLEHANESLAALHEGVDGGRIGLFSTVARDIAADPVSVFRARVRRLVGAWTAGESGLGVAIADRLLALSLAAGAAAVEIAVHGWDIAQASEHHRPIPPELAMDLLAISAVLLSDGNRHPLFAPPVRPSTLADPSERLLAFLGRQPTVMPEPTPTRTDVSRS
jgi:uncharacterized protein (TIGR03086 family)